MLVGVGGGRVAIIGMLECKISIVCFSICRYYSKQRLLIKVAAKTINDSSEDQALLNSHPRTLQYPFLVYYTLTHNHTINKC